MKKDESVSRRRFLNYIIGGCAGLIGVLVGIPIVVSTVISPVLLSRKKIESEWVELGKAQEFKAGRPTLVRWTEDLKDGWVSTIAYRVVWVYTADGQNFTVLNPKCTHLGCLTYFDDQVNTINSPCHAGVFGLPDGRVIAGPPPRPLDTMPVKVQDGKVYCIYKDFRLGITDKIEL